MDPAAVRTTSGPLRVVNPATGAFVAEVAEADEAAVEAAMTRARRAQPAWARLSVRERGRCLRRLAGRLVRDPTVVESIVSETGKARYEAEAIEVFYTAELTRFLTGRAGRRALADDLRHPFIFAHKRSRVVFHPHGVVGVIGPWNWPLLNNYADCVAPLLAGNAVILKPSPLTPLTSLRIAEIWREQGLPEDVLQVLPGGGEVGAALVERADMIFFTGSPPVGRRIAARCAERLVPCVLELGGKSAMLVLRDADLAEAARCALWGSFANSGQVCVRPERIIVDEAVADAFVAECLARMARLRQGIDPVGEVRVDVDVGAIIFPPQLERVERHIEDAVARRAQRMVGGQRRPDLGGCFFEPTLLDHVRPDMQVAREETFGPVLPVIRVRDEDEAVRVANETGLGLAGAVFSRDEARALEIARRMETGSVCVNDALVHYFCVESPLGGVKGSGLGFRHGPESLRQFCRVQTIVEDHPILGIFSVPIERQLSFPYQTTVLKILRWVMRRLY